MKSKPHRNNELMLLGYRNLEMDELSGDNITSQKTNKMESGVFNTRFHRRQLVKRKLICVNSLLASKFLHSNS